MKVIIEEHKRGAPFVVKELMKEELVEARKEAKYIEMDFEMRTGKRQLPALEIFKGQGMLLASLGALQLEERVDAQYEMDEGILKDKNANRSINETYWISCYSKSQRITAIKYLECIKQLTSWAAEYKRPLIIYSDLVPVEKYYLYRSLTAKIRNTLLEKVNGVLVSFKPKEEIAAYYIPSHKAFEFYIENGIYLTCDYEEMIQRIVECFEGNSAIDFKQVYRKKRQVESLYSDLFYQLIPKEQKIYVPLAIEGGGTEEYFSGLGFSLIKGTNNYSLLYETKEKLDSQAEALRQYVIPSYTCPVLERGEEATMTSKAQTPYKVVPGDLAYKGKGTYIAIISREGIDYRTSTLRLPTGETRIAGMWEQIDGGNGNFYDKEQINAALQSQFPEQVVPIDKNSNYNTMLFGIAGGKNDEYEGIASEAEFLVAKVNSAPETLQRIYGGMPNERNILMADLMIGIWQLQNFARKQNKSIVFYIPYYTNIDGHDGLDFYNVLLSFIGVTGGSAIIVPTGEEGDKEHHQILFNEGEEQPVVNLKVDEEDQNILGLITQRYVSTWQIDMLGTKGQRIDLRKAGISELDGMTIYSQGERPNFYNGSKDVMFRIEHMKKGVWQMEIDVKDSEYNRVDLWISGKQFNPSVTLLPYSPYVTIGSTGNISGTTCVGGYNLEQMTTFRSSGRGFRIDNVVKPVLAAGGIVQSINTLGQQMEMEGTEVSASVVLGAAATIFNKWETEREQAFLNGLLLNSILLEYVTRVANVQFPNPNQGYGIFEGETLNKILLTPFS